MTELLRKIKLHHAIAMVAGTIIGASIFVQPSEISHHIPTVWGILLVWVICGILTLFGSLVCAELSSIYTKAGGVYIYLKEAFSPSFGFLWGWSMFWIMHSGIIAAVAVIFARYCSTFYDLSPTVTKLIAIGLIVFHSTVNILGVKKGSQLQTIFTALKIFAIIIIIVIGFTAGTTLEGHFQSGSADYSHIGIGNWVSAIIAGLFAFGGWHMVTYNAEETIDSKSNIPKALIWGTLIVTLSYLGMNAVYLYIMPLPEMAASQKVAADAADILFGQGGAAFMAVIVLISTFGSISGIILSGPRVYYSMAKDKLLFSWLGDIHHHFKTPHKALIAQAVWSSFLVFTGTYRELFTRVIFIEWLFFGLMAVGLILLRNRKSVQRSFWIWGYPAVPILFIFASFFIVAHKMITDPVESLFGIGLIVSGWIVFHIFKLNNPQSNDH